MAIPARFREMLSERLHDERLVVTNFRREQRPCLDVWPVPTWDGFLKRVRRRKGTGQFQEWYVGNSADVSLDSQGRILIPPTLRSWGRIERDVVIVGLDDRFRIWSSELHQENNSDNEHAVFGDKALLDDLGL